MKNRKQGFTLVEIMIVVMIIGLLAAIALPGFKKARVASQTNACINNLRVINGAKKTWALENNKIGGNTPSDTDIYGEDAYIDEKPTCPASGTYTMGTVNEDPTCSITPHEL